MIVSVSPVSGAVLSFASTSSVVAELPFGGSTLVAAPIIAGERVLGAVLIGCIQAFNEGLRWHSPGSDWTQSIVFSILMLLVVAAMSFFYVRKMVRVGEVQ